MFDEGCYRIHELIISLSIWSEFNKRLSKFHNHESVRTLSYLCCTVLYDSDFFRVKWSKNERSFKLWLIISPIFVLANDLSNRFNSSMFKYSNNLFRNKPYNISQYSSEFEFKHQFIPSNYHGQFRN